MPVKVTLGGRVWEKDAGERLIRGLNKALGDVAEEGADFVREEIQPGHGYLSGRFHDSISGGLQKDLVGLVQSKDSRQIKTWLETGKRRGVKTRRKGGYFFRHGQQKLERTGKLDNLADDIVKALN